MTWPLTVKPQLTTKALHVPRITESLLSGYNLRWINGPIIVENCWKMQHKICFPFFHPFYVGSRYHDCSHTVVTSSVTPIKLMVPCTYILEFVTPMAWDSCHKSNLEYLEYVSNEQKMGVGRLKNNSSAQKSKAPLHLERPTRHAQKAYLQLT